MTWQSQIIREFGALCYRRGYSIRKAAGLVGVHYSYLAEILCRTKQPSAVTLGKLVIFLDKQKKIANSESHENQAIGGMLENS